MKSAKWRTRIDNLLVPLVVERVMRENPTTGSVPFRKVYLRSLIDVIEVDDAQIRIKGSKDILERAVLASRAGTESGSQMSTKWRANYPHSNIIDFRSGLPGVPVVN
jgi:hypothetical protein